MLFPTVYYSVSFPIIQFSVTASSLSSLSHLLAAEHRHFCLCNKYYNEEFLSFEILLNLTGHFQSSLIRCSFVFPFSASPQQICHGQYDNHISERQHFIVISQGIKSMVENQNK